LDVPYRKTNVSTSCSYTYSSDTPYGPTELIEDAELEYERARIHEKFRASLKRRREIMEKFILEPNGFLQFNFEEE
jgi:hypothetical protein